VRCQPNHIKVLNENLNQDDNKDEQAGKNSRHRFTSWKYYTRFLLQCHRASCEKDKGVSLGKMTESLEAELSSKSTRAGRPEHLAHLERQMRCQARIGVVQIQAGQLGDPLHPVEQ